jgi:hypothetical protein
MLEGPIAKVLGFPMVVQFRVAVLDPLIVRLIIEPLLVSVAVPVTVHVPDRFPEGSQLALAVSVAVEPLAMKPMLPGTVIVTPLQTTMNLKLMVYEFPAVKSIAFMVTV